MVTKNPPLVRPTGDFLCSSVFWYNGHMEKIKTIIIVPITLAVLAGGGYYAYRDIIGTGTDLNDDTDLGYTIEELSTPTISSETEVLTSLSVPDLDRMVINNEYLPAEAVAIV